MDNEQLTKAFRDAFVEASKHDPGQYSYSIRILTVILCLVTTVMVINYFIGKASKEGDTYVTTFTALTVKLLIVAGFLLIYLL